MKLHLFVHECEIEQGHTNAMIELLNNSKLLEKTDQINLVSYKFGTNKSLFPNHANLIKKHKVPFSTISPALIKNIFYHLYTLFYQILFVKKDDITISIGVAALKADIYNIQFIQKQWSEYYFKINKLGLIKILYKKFFFSYLSFIEKKAYSRKSSKFIILSQFIYDYMQLQYKISESQLALCYSGINTDRFKLSNLSRSDRYSNLQKHHEELSKLSENKKTALFVGAYERKGLHKAIEILNTKSNWQFIIVGKSESSSSKLPEIKIPHVFITFTNKIQDFYGISDLFIFPSIYEPFGLVLLEAYSLGCSILTNKSFIGASELLEKTNDNNIQYIDQGKINFDQFEMINDNQRIRNIETRKEFMKKYSWKNAAKDFDKLNKI